MDDSRTFPVLLWTWLTLATVATFVAIASALQRANMLF